MSLLWRRYSDSLKLAGYCLQVALIEGRAAHGIYSIAFDRCFGASYDGVNLAGHCPASCPRLSARNCYVV